MHVTRDFRPARSSHAPPPMLPGDGLAAPLLQDSDEPGPACTAPGPARAEDAGPRWRAAAGRPDLSAILCAALSHRAAVLRRSGGAGCAGGAEECAVVACGPPGMMAAAETAARRAGMHWHLETFAL